MPIDSRQYDSVIDYTGDDTKMSRLLGNIVADDDKVRLKAYTIYEDMYHNRPENIRIQLRGDDEDSIQIYMPSAKKCIEAVNRYLAVGWKIQVDPTMQQEQEQAAIVGAFMDSVFKRERLKSKFNQMKRYMLIKGDALLHIRADPNKPAGKRICIDELKAEHYFPIENGDGERIGCHIVDVVANPRNTLKLRYHKSNEIVRRQTYRKEINKRTGIPTGRVTSELALYEIGKWDDRYLEDKDLELVEQIRNTYYLPSAITQIPVYHWRNAPPPGSSFGMSELAGVESIVSAINQSMSDEDLTLIMQGLGVYWTDASPPLNAAGEEVEWEISPRSVVQVASGGNFNRVSGITTVQPFGDHIKALDEAMQQALGVPDIAIGEVDVTIAESGIARQMKMSPLIAKNLEKELDMIDVADQFIYDLVSGWFVAYEKLLTIGVNYVNAFDSAMPKDKSHELSDLLSIWTTAPNILPIAWFYEQLNEIMGYHLDPTGDFDAALQDAQRIAEASVPPAPELPPGSDTGNGDMATSGSSSSNGKAK